MIMDDKQEILTTLREEFDRWEELLAGLSEAQITASHLPSDLSIKDVIAHLWAWQQRSVARLEGGLLNREPEFPKWPAELNPESEDDIEQVNAWIHETYREQPWSSVHQGWRANFQRLVGLGEAIPQKDLLDANKYPWLEGYSLAQILLASYKHHHFEHLEPLVEWLRQH
jgi:hypothetical protein